MVIFPQGNDPCFQFIENYQITDNKKPHYMTLRTFIPFLITVFFLRNVTAQSGNESYINYLKENLPQKSEIDMFLQEKGWVKFDVESGYTLNNSLLHDGMDNCNTIVTSQDNLARTQFMYINQPCRINTYGNSFTQSSQVSDGETWQEYLAAHLGEPVRNYGVGGLGVYQAYRRMLRTESSADSAEYIILYIWGDDHIRSLLRCRYMLTRDWHIKQYDREDVTGKVFHGNFWPNLEMDMSTGKLTECANRILQPEDTYKMLDEDWMIENLQDDLALQMYLFKQGKIEGVNTGKLQILSDYLGLDLDLNDPSKVKESVSILLDKYGFAATRYILAQARLFAQSHNRKLMVVLFDPYKVTRSLIEEGTRYDQEIMDWLDQNNFNYFDMNLAHVEDYRSFNLNLDDYMKRYFIGHYNPAGNHFFAFSIKDKIIEWLELKPITYKDKEKAAMEFNGYLEGVNR